MSRYSVVDRQPEAVELDGTDGDTLLVAAPALGPDAAPSKLVSPSAVVDRLDSRQPLDGEASADGGVTTGSETPLDEDADVCVLPDLYAAYCEADDAAGLTTALGSQTPLAAVVAPHELDWLLGSDSPFTKSHLGGFDRIVQLRYDPDGGEADETVRAAVDAAAAALDKDDLSEMDRRAIWSALESFAYSHEYSHEALVDAGADGQYGPTLTPGIATYVSTGGARGSRHRRLRRARTEGGSEDVRPGRERGWSPRSWASGSSGPGEHRQRWVGCLERHQCGGGTRGWLGRRGRWVSGSGGDWIRRLGGHP